MCEYEESAIFPFKKFANIFDLSKFNKTYNELKRKLNLKRLKSVFILNR